MTALALAERAPALAPMPTMASHFLDALAGPPPQPGRPGIDRIIRASLGKLTGAVSPASLALAYLDWASHIAASPGKLTLLGEEAARNGATLWLQALGLGGDTAPALQDSRFRGEAWQSPPFSLFAQTFLLGEAWWRDATSGVAGVSTHHEQVVSFVARQILDMMAPSNFVTTNPELLEATLRSAGKNLADGLGNLVIDSSRALSGQPPVGTEAFRPGDSVAVTPGSVIYRNRLIELIQYSPTTATVQAEPVLIVPAWIMKYYILDLSPQNSLIKYLVDQGHTVFAISWHNPDAEDRALGLDEYIRLGVLDALDVIETVLPGRAVHALGYCLGGTLLAITAALLAQQQPDRLATVTLLAAQTDFTEAGELTLFLDESQLTYLEDVMWDQGYLDARQMSGAFQLLRSADLIWSRMLREYLMGRREPMTDLMAWNADATRMPARMHSEYLRRLFLENELFEGRFTALGRPVALEDIKAPIFAVGTESDHVAPWHSVYKIHLLAGEAITFVLTSGGHNAGIVSEPGHPHRHFRSATRQAGDRYVDPETWFMRQQPKDGSWWPDWVSWLAAHSSGIGAPPPMGNAAAGYPPLESAPGRYVHEQ